MFDAQLDLAVRGGSSALLLLWAWMLLRDTRQGLGAFFAVGAAAYAWCSAYGAPPPELHPYWLLVALCTGNPLIFVGFIRYVFVDARRPSWRFWALYLALMALGLTSIAAQYLFPAAVAGILRVLHALLVAGLGIAALWYTLSGFNDDLVDERRRLRPIFAGLAASYLVGIGLVELGLGGMPPPAWLKIANSLLLFGFAFVVVAIFSRAPKPGVMRPAPPRALGAPRPSAEAQAVLHCFEVNRLHRDPALSLAILAHRTGLAEHRLRRVINDELDHRNFATFVNSFRLAEVAAALRDASQDEVPITTLAFDAGFGSLGTFNRAFRAAYGKTPSEFRRSSPKGPKGG